LSQEFFHVKFSDLALMTRERIRWQLGWNHERAEMITSAIFVELLKTTRDIGAVPVFVYLPVLKDIEDLQDGLTHLFRERSLERSCENKFPAVASLNAVIKPVRGAKTLGRFTQDS
jgi:hypothetical protein